MATPTKPRTRKSTSAAPRGSGTSGAKASAPQTGKVGKVTEAEATEAAVQTADDDRLKRPDLIEAIAKRVSLKRSETKMVFDVVLDEIGKALDASDEVVVPPLGKFMVKKRQEKPGGGMLTLKLKRAEADPAAGDVAPLADPE